MKALVLTTANSAATLLDVPTPEPEGNQILVKVHAVALNPVDALYVAKPIAKQPQRIVGSDFAGEVVRVPESLRNADDPRLKIGARVAGYLQGACSANDRPGAFAEYITPEHDLVWLIPDRMSYSQAASIPMCAMTSAQGVFFRLKLPCPFYDVGESQSDTVDDTLTAFVYGSSTSLGMYAAQWLRLAAKTAGRKIHLIGAASRSKHGMLTAEPYSYDALVDYRDQDWTEQVRKLTGGKGVDVGVDCISEGKTVAGVCTVLKDDGKYAVFRAPAGGGYSLDELRIKPIYGAVWEGLGAEIQYYNFTVPANPQARAFAANLFRYLTNGAAKNEVLIEPNPIREMPGGLERIPSDGFYLLGAGVMASALKVENSRTEDYMRPISGEKLVYSLN